MKKNKKTRAELGKTFLKYHGKKAFIVKMGEFCSVVPRRIFVPLSRYGRPNIEPKFSYKFYTKTLDRSIRCILSQCRYSKFYKNISNRPPTIVGALQFHLGTQKINIPVCQDSGYDTSPFDILNLSAVVCETHQFPLGIIRFLKT